MAREGALRLQERRKSRRTEIVRLGKAGRVDARKERGDDR